MKKWIWIWAAAALVGCGRHLERVGSVDIVPEPSDVRVGEGVFSLTRRTEIRLSDGDSSLARAAGFFGELAGKSLGRPLAVVRGGRQESGAICVALGNLPAEAYVLSVRSDRIDLTGGSPAGVFYGFQTLRQMLPESALRGEKARAIDLPVVEIRDEPRIGYRALLLDAGRHFFGPEEVKSVIDLMAMHKLNRLQWHLTEDQGWRIEIRKYPELTRRGAWRDRSDLRPAEDGRPEKDPQPYGGYYTQQQVREIVRYAADRFIEIVPEIEMPGHAMAALASYPWLGCLGEGYEVPSLWGVKEDVYCAGKDSTFVFLEDVLTEVTDLFPYGLVHIGGDECPKARWKECPRCQRRMRDEGLGSEEELQSYFVRRIERFLASRNRRMVGWDEIRQGGLSETAIVLSRKRRAGASLGARKRQRRDYDALSELLFRLLSGQSRDRAAGFRRLSAVADGLRSGPVRGLERRAVAPDSGRAVQPVDRIRCDARPCRVYVAAPIGGFRRTGLDGRRRELSRFPEAFGVVLAAVRRAGIRVSGFPVGSR